ncbi:MAG: glycoside hydrolase family 30 protein [Elusimicrobia bacterium]|nr:glycoside hydrolase family 30 protein [Elusimicrobiota bacterium]
MKRTILSLCLLILAGCARQPDGPAFSTWNKKVSVYITADKTEYRLSPEGAFAFKPFSQPLETEPCVFVDPSKLFQAFVGIGGALTDAAAETFAKLPLDKQQEVLTAYFDRKAGIGYSLARTPMNSSDFSSGSYTYVDEGDKELKSFSVAHDLKYRIPFIKRAIAAAGGELTLFVSPWSPPAWMKDNNDILHGGKLKKEFSQSWADYYVKFIKAYEKEGIPVWGLTVQNEPMAVQKWESCVYTAEEERDFIKNYLGPTLEKEGLAAKKLIGWDHNRDLLFQRAVVLLDDPDTAKYLWGIGFHWYEKWHGDSIFENVKRTREAYPDTNLILTEACNYPFSWKTIDDWNWGELYGKSMINDFNNGAAAWTDWNVLLDETGGPNHAGNFCFAPLHGDTRKGSLRYMNSYYYIGHFSKFIRPGARRAASSSSRAQLLTTAFLNKDGSLAVIVMNQSGDNIPYRLWIAGKAAALAAPPHSIATLVVE